MGSSGQPIAMKVLLSTCLLASALAHVDYTGHQLIRTRPGTAEQAEALQELQQEVGVDFWLEPVLGRAVDVRVAPEQADDLHRFFNHSGLRVEVLSNNIQQLLDSVPMVKGSARSGHSMDWTAYHPIEDIYSFAMELRDTGNYGFILPPEQIIPTGEEVWAFHLTVARQIIQEFVPRQL